MTLDEQINDWLDTSSEVTGASIRAALHQLGYAVVPRSPCIRVGRLGAARLETSTYATPGQRMMDAYRTMIREYEQSGNIGK